MIARHIAERVVRPVVTDNQKPAVGLFIEEEAKFVIPVEFVFGTPGGNGLATEQFKKRAQTHLLEELRLVVERAVQSGLTIRQSLQSMTPDFPKGGVQPLDVQGVVVDAGKGKVSLP